MNNTFIFNMSKAERIIGCIFIPIHAAVLPMLLSFICLMIWPALSETGHTLLHYTVSFLFVVVFIFRFLKDSFSRLIESFWLSVQAVILGYALYYISTMALSFLMARIFTEVNPNTEALLQQAVSNYKLIFAVLIVLSPIVEETIFRGALFGSLRQINRPAAYIVSALVFSIYHIWQLLIPGFSPNTLLFILSYLPASIALAWCYERSNTIWSSIILHAIINFISISAIR